VKGDEPLVDRTLGGLGYLLFEWGDESPLLSGARDLLVERRRGWLGYLHFGCGHGSPLLSAGRRGSVSLSGCSSQGLAELLGDPSPHLQANSKEWVVHLVMGHSRAILAQRRRSSAI
jgi:hypothetical protein